MISNKLTIFILNLTLVVLLAHSLSTQAATFSERRAARNQADFAVMVNNKLNQIEQRYAAELAVLNGNSFESANFIILKKAKKDYWFFAIERYTSAISNYSRMLTKFKTGKILSNQSLLDHNHVLAQTLDRLNQVQANLQNIIVSLALEDIENAYTNEFAITDLNDQNVLAKTIFTQIKQKWFKSRVRYRIAVASRINCLNQIQITEINNNYLAWQTDLKLSKTLARFNLAQQNLHVLDRFMRQDPSFIKAMQWAKFWFVVTSAIVITAFLLAGGFGIYAVFWSTKGDALGRALFVIIEIPILITSLGLGAGAIYGANTGVKAIDSITAQVN